MLLGFGKALIETYVGLYGYSVINRKEKWTVFNVYFQIDVGFIGTVP